MTVIILFILGACFGSFLNVLIDRVPKHRSIILGRSKCENCHKIIAWYDLIPMLSYIALKGKCGKCNAKISPRLFYVELVCALLFPLSWTFAFVNIYQLLVLLAILLVLVGISVIDIEQGIIPDKLLLLLGFLSIIYLTSTTSLTVQHLITAIVAFCFFLLIFLVTRGRGMGFGDVKYAFFIGFLLNSAQLVGALYAAFLTGAALSIILIIGGKKKLKGESIAFGPFLSLGVIFAMLFEKEIEQSLKIVFGM